MKKVFLTSVASLAIVFPALANIDKSASTATCDSATIGATSGNAYMDTAWTANTINLQWYSNGEQINVSGTDSATCTYDGTITLPNTPDVPTGYTFGGWRVRVAAAQSGFDLSTWTYGTVPSWNAQYTRWKCFTSDNCYSMEDDFGTENSSDLSNGEWAITFGNGTVKGEARCSTQEPANGDLYNTEVFILDNFESDLADETDQEAGQFCWCKATAYAPFGGSTQNVASSSWASAYGLDCGNADDCTANCAVYCVNGILYVDEFRRAVFGISE